MNSEYLDQLKRIQEGNIVGELGEQISFLEKLIKNKREELEYLKRVSSKSVSELKEYAELCFKAKEENLSLLKSGIKRCLCCKDERNTDSNEVFSSCPSCHAKCWLVGTNYPCEICKRIVLSPVLHHVNGTHEDNSSENIIFICSDCHTAIHHGIGNQTINSKGRRTKRRDYILEPEVRQLINYYQNQLIKVEETNI